ncbi:MAG: rSAM/selenodomain-associated transferase 2 [Arenicella sp.]
MPDFVPRRLSVIVPVLNERDRLAALVEHLASIAADQTIIVDGGSKDGSAVWLLQNWNEPELGRVFIQTLAGRAKQMNAGADHANGDVLLFLHADSTLPVGAKREVLRARELQSLWGRFDVAFRAEKRSRIAMRVIALFMNIRSRLSSIATGDQAIFVDRILFRTIGGYQDMPLMEDVALSKMLKRHCVPYCSSLRTTTSARRWQNHGLLQTVVTMWYLRLAYFFGVSPHKLLKRYQDIR